MKTWTTNHILTAILLAAHAGLVIDLRSEHADAVGYRWQAWIPIVWSGFVAVIGSLLLGGWTRGDDACRQDLMCVFAGSIIVGCTGVWLHNQGHLLTAAIHVLGAWFGGTHHAGPPRMAPLAFVLLGSLGVLVTLSRMQLPKDGA